LQEEPQLRPGRERLAGPFSILSCGSSVARRRGKALPLQVLALSVSYPADRRLQVPQHDGQRRKVYIFQYPILRIVGCKHGQGRRASRRY